MFFTQIQKTTRMRAEPSESKQTNKVTHTHVFDNLFVNGQRNVGFGVC